MKMKLLTILLCGFVVLGTTGCDNTEKENAANNKEENKTSINIEKEENKVEQKTNKEIEDEAFGTDFGELSNYDSEVFYAKDRKITYKVLDNFKTRRKSISTTRSYEEYTLTNGTEKIHLRFDLYYADLYEDYLHIYEGKEGKNDPAEGLFASMKNLANMTSQSFEGKDVITDNGEIMQIGKYKVYYMMYDSNTLAQSGSETINIIGCFDIDDKYLISVEMYTFKNNDVANLVSVESLKKIIESFNVEKY